MADRPWDVAVVGLGGLGSAAAYWLARRGARVVGFEQFDLGHVRGASHDRSRIIRRSYHTPGYVELAASAYAAWAQVEEDAGQPIVTRTGGIDLFPPGSAIDSGVYTSSLRKAGVPYEWIDGGEVCRRWPAFAGGGTVETDVMAIFQEDAGIVPADRATAMLQRLAVRHGATLRERTQVREVRPVGGGVELVTDVDVQRCAAVIVACDAWVNRLLRPLGHELPLVVLREQVSYFPVTDLGPFEPGRFPVWIWMDDPSFYGFPVYGDPTAVKAAEDCGGFEVDPDTRTFDPDRTGEERVSRFMEGLVGPGVGRPRTTTCLYTMTADRDFVLDRLPDHPQVLVALGAAHGFKFASWFGRTLAELTLDGGASDDITSFSLTRPGLHRPVVREAWLV